MVKVTIESDEIGKVVLEYENINVSESRGYRRHEGDGVQMLYEPNGHRKAEIKLWSGCKNFEDYKAVSDRGH